MFRVVRRLICALALAAVASAAQAEMLRAGGTGIGLALARKAGQALQTQDPDVRVDVLPSLGTPGGLKALLAGEIGVALAARPLKADEKAKGLREAACVRSAFAFVTSRPASPGIRIEQLPDIYTRPAPLWPDGQPLKVILRSPAGSENDYLSSLHPKMKEALAAAAARPGIPAGATDQENVELLQRTAGSFGLSTLLQVKSEALSLTVLAVNGVEPSPATLADGTYPMPMSLCFVVPAAPTPAADKFIAFMRSAAGRDLTRRYGAEPIE